MFWTQLWKQARIGLALMLTVLLLGSAMMAASAAGPELFQYPPPTEPYPGPDPDVTETPTATLLVTVDGSPTLLPTFTATPSNTPTLAPDLRLTEDSQLGNSLSTQSASATPGPSITPVRSRTATPTITPLPAASGPKSGWLDWGFFALGLSAPLLVGCGFVLYWLDRRPDLFSG